MAAISSAKAADLPSLARNAAALGSNGALEALLHTIDVLASEASVERLTPDELDALTTARVTVLGVPVHQITDDGTRSSVSHSKGTPA